MRLIDADVLKQHIDKLPALPDGNFAGNHSALKTLINMQPTIESSTNCSEIQNSSDCISRQAAIDAIANCTNCGTPDELRKYVDKHSLENGWTGGVLDAMEAVEDIPAADVVPVRHGKWLPIVSYNNTYKCSECGRLLVDIADGLKMVAKHYPYCHCGAKMDV